MRRIIRTITKVACAGFILANAVDAGIVGAATQSGGVDAFDDGVVDSGLWTAWRTTVEIEMHNNYSDDDTTPAGICSWTVKSAVSDATGSGSGYFFAGTDMGDLDELVGMISADDGTEALILDSQALSGDTTISMDFDSLGSDGTVSDALRLTGLDGQMFALQMSYENSPSLEGKTLTLSWWDENVGRWVNAVDGNSIAGGAFYNNQAYNSSLFSLGNYGIDRENQVVWAVLDHNSDFTVIPEPNTFIMVGLFTVGWSFHRRRFQFLNEHKSRIA